MKKPKIIFFDYGQTISNEKLPNTEAGMKALMSLVDNPNGVTMKEMLALNGELRHDIGWTTPDPFAQPVTEVHNHSYWNYMFDYFGLELKVSYYEAERIFWEAASPTVPTDGIGKLLDHLHKNGFRSAVISNMSYCEKTLSDRIRSLVPDHHFEFIISTSEYVFRKPNRRIFELALRKAGVSPEEAWHCGDNLGADVAGSSAVGITPVWYKGALWKQQENPYTCMEISHWMELADILDKCE